jgi:hypothetical protein
MHPALQAYSSVHMAAYPLAVHGIHRTVTDILSALFPFPLYQALP